jgi:hypothetical protein
MLIDEVASRLKDYPPYSQEGRDDPIVACKLFNAFGSGTWYLTEYDPTDHVAFGFVTGLQVDEWGYVSIDELSGLKKGGVPMIEVDLHFSPVSFSQVLR